MSGPPPLLAAAYKGNAESVKKQLQAGADVNAADEGGKTSLHYAAAYGHSAVVDVLLAAGADTQLRDKKNRTACEFAAASGQRGTAAMLNPHVVIGSHKGSLSLVKAALSSGQDVNTLLDGRSALHMAACYGHGSIVAFLLEAGASTTVTDPKKRTAEQFARQYNQPAAADLIKAHEAARNARKRGREPAEEGEGGGGAPAGKRAAAGLGESPRKAAAAAQKAPPRTAAAAAATPPPPRTTTTAPTPTMTPAPTAAPARTPTAPAATPTPRTTATATATTTAASKPPTTAPTPTAPAAAPTVQYAGGGGAGAPPPQPSSAASSLLEQKKRATAAEAEKLEKLQTREQARRAHAAEQQRQRRAADAAAAAQRLRRQQQELLLAKKARPATTPASSAAAASQPPRSSAASRLLPEDAPRSNQPAPPPAAGSLAPPPPSSAGKTAVFAVVPAIGAAEALSLLAGAAAGGGGGGAAGGVAGVVGLTPSAAAAAKPRLSVSIPLLVGEVARLAAAMGPAAAGAPAAKTRSDLVAAGEALEMYLREAEHLHQHQQQQHPSSGRAAECCGIMRGYAAAVHRACALALADESSAPSSLHQGPFSELLGDGEDAALRCRKVATASSRELSRLLPMVQGGLRRFDGAGAAAAAAGAGAGGQTAAGGALLTAGGQPALALSSSTATRPPVFTVDATYFKLLVSSAVVDAGATASEWSLSIHGPSEVSAGVPEATLPRTKHLVLQRLELGMADALRRLGTDGSDSRVTEERLRESADVFCAAMTPAPCPVCGQFLFKDPLTQVLVPPTLFVPALGCLAHHCCS
ncbi:hypothetical protein DIPPA_34210 [Diplonema papillatum]|nr:hypothetical protein DIPPA_34210 [Diplonema papillatum]